MKPALAILAVLAIAPLAWPATASACSAPPSCPYLTGTMPPDGATDVPTNVELEAIYFYPCEPAEGADGCPSGADLVLRVAGTVDPIPLSSSPTRDRSRPAEPLEPATTYELLALVYDAFRGSCAAGVTVEPSVVATFTTGDGPDTSPPRAPRVGVAGCSILTCDDGGCCGPYVAAVSQVRVTLEDDSTLPIALALGTPEGPHYYTSSLGAVQLISGWGFPMIPSPAPIGRITGLLAIDAAGNVSAVSDPPDFDLSCRPPDAGPWGPDGSVASDGSVSMPADASAAAPASPGCACATAAREPSLAHLAIGVITIVAARSRGRRRRRIV